MTGGGSWHCPPVTTFIACSCVAFWDQYQKAPIDLLPLFSFQVSTLRPYFIWPFMYTSYRVTDWTPHRFCGRFFDSLQPEMCRYLKRSIPHLIFFYCLPNHGLFCFYWKLHIVWLEFYIRRHTSPGRLACRYWGRPLKPQGPGSSSYWTEERANWEMSTLIRDVRKRDLLCVFVIWFCQQMIVETAGTLKFLHTEVDRGP